MKIMKKLGYKTLVAAVALGLTGAAQAADYKGTAYVAGMGGHFAEADFTIDPSDSKPIKVKDLGMVIIGDGYSHPTHDARIDYKDRNTMFWSTYKIDADADALHIGKSDLKTGDVVKDQKVPVPKQVVNDSKNYCASGQTEDYFFPIAMTNPGFITVARKDDLKVEHQVFIEGTEADPGVPYKYMHGVTSPDMSEMLITMNESDNKSLKEYGTTIGKMHMVVLDTAALEKGKIKVLRKGTADGNFKSTISFRQYYSPDGKYIANATGDILFIIDAKTLEVIDAETVGMHEQLHDAIFTPDGKYVVATSRTKRISPDCLDRTKPKPGEFLMDGHLKLYDVEAKKFIGKSSSTCLKCHDEQLGTGDFAVHAVLCGLDVNWK